MSRFSRRARLQSTSSDFLKPVIIFGALLLVHDPHTAAADMAVSLIAQAQQPGEPKGEVSQYDEFRGTLRLAQLVPAGWVILVHENADGSLIPVQISSAVGRVKRVERISESAVIWVYIDSDTSYIKPLQVEADGGLTPARADADGVPMLPKNLAMQNVVLTAQVLESGRLFPIIRSTEHGLIPVTVDADGAIVRSDKATVSASAEADEGQPEISLEIDNSGSGETGVFNVTGIVSYEAFAGTDHQLTIGSSLSATEPDKYASIFTSYVIPVEGLVEDLPDSLSLSGYAYNIDYDNKTSAEPRASRYAINGYGTAAKYTQFVDYDAPEGEAQLAQALSYGISFDRYWTRDYGFDQNSRTSILRIPLAISYNLWRNDEVLGNTSLSFGYTRNLSVGSAGDGRDYEADRVRADPRYDKWTALAYHGKQFESGWETTVTLNGQFAREPLISAEGFALGGLYSVRGLEDSKTVGDSGVTGQFEVLTPNILKGDTVSGKLLAFADYGWTKLKQPPVGDPGSETAFSVGGGVELARGERAHMNLLVGRLSGGTAVDRYEDEDGRIQVYFSAGITF